MNSLKILTSDNLVIVDGVPLTIAVGDLIDSAIWAISFENGVGEVEYSQLDRPNEIINHIGDYQEIIDLHGTELAKINESQAEIAQQNASEAAALQVKITGFEFRGVQISYTREDRALVLEANQALDKKKPDGQYYLSDDQALTLKFSNGTNLPLNREEFETEFFPVFFGVAASEFM